MSSEHLQHAKLYELIRQIVWIKPAPFVGVWVLNEQLSQDHRRTKRILARCCGEYINNHKAETSWSLWRSASMLLAASARQKRNEFKASVCVDCRRIVSGRITDYVITSVITEWTLSKTSYCKDSRLTDPNLEDGISSSSSSADINLAKEKQFRDSKWCSG